MHRKILSQGTVTVDINNILDVMAQLTRLFARSLNHIGHLPVEILKMAPSIFKLDLESSGPNGGTAEVKDFLHCILALREMCEFSSYSK